MGERCTAELRSIDFYLVNSEEKLLKVVARLEKLEKDEIMTTGKSDYNNRLEQEKMDQLRSFMVSLDGIQTIKNQENYDASSEMEI